MLWTNCIFSIMSRYKTFYRNQYTNIFLGHFLNIEENNSWTIQCHRYEIFQVNALIGVIPFSDWPCWGSRTVCIKCYSSHLLGNWWKGDLLLKWRNCVTLHSLEICGFHLLLFVNCRLLSHQFQGNVYITLGTFAIRWLAITTYHFKGQNPWWWLLFKFFCGDITSQQSFLLLTELGLRLQPFWLLWQLANLAIDYLAFAVCA